MNSYTAGTQRLFDSGDAVAAMPDGGYVATWTSEGQDGSGMGVYGQRFGADGTPLGSEFLVNTTIDRSQQRSSVSVAADGSFVVVWDSNGQDGILAGIFGRRYDADGQALGNEFQVNETSLGHQCTPAVACLDDGGFVVVWSGPGNGDLWGVFGRRYDADGQAVGGEFRVNSEISNLQRLPAVAALSYGGFIVAWQSHGGQDGDNTGIFAQRFDADCDPVGGEFQVNTTTEDYQQYPAVAAGPDGQFTIAWQSEDQDGSGYGIFAQRFGVDGETFGGEFQVNTTTCDDQLYPSVAYNDHGGFVVAWNGKGPGDNSGVFVREYDADGVALGDESLVNTTTSGTQQFATVASASSGYVVVWSGKGTGDNEGVFLQRLGFPPTTSGIADVSVSEDSSDTTIDLGDSFDYAGSGGAQLTYQFTDNTNPSLFDSVNITGDLLTLDYTADAFGSVDITIRATEPGGLFVETTFTVNVAPINDAPVALPFDPIEVAEDAPQMAINLGSVFQDIDDWCYGLRYEVISNSNPALFGSVQLSESGRSLLLDFAPETSGTAEIILRVTDEEGLWTEAAVSVTVTAVNDPPVAAPPTTVLARQGAAAAVLDLSTLFSDVDDPLESLGYQVVANSNSTLVATQLQDAQLTLSYQPGQTGTAAIVVRAADPAGHYGDCSYHTINVTVSASNLAPQITGLLDAPDPSIEGATLHLTASGVIDDTAVASVAFWRDADHSDTFDPNVDQLLGIDTDGSDGWGISVSSAGFGIGAQRYFAQATDEDALAGNVATATGIVGAVAILDNGEAGYQETGEGWMDNAGGGYLDTARRHEAGSGTSTATWTFDGLMVKGHEVYVTWQAEAGLASNAQFSVYDGEQLLDTFTVDQRVAPDEVDEDGVAWLKLGEYTIANGQLTVELTDAADGPVVADAVKLVDAVPEIDSLGVTSPVTRDWNSNNVTLTAYDVTDSDGTVVGVSFYRDTNGNSVYDDGVDELLGTGTADGDDWSLSVCAATFSTGTQTYFAIAVDNDTNESDPAWVQGIIEGPAVYGPTSAYEGNTYTLQLDPTDIDIEEWTIDWGDGSDEDVVPGSTRSLTHVYDDGPNSWTIEVTGVYDSTTYYANTIDVDVLNVAPYLSVSGEAAVTEGAQYTLYLSVDDPGDDTIDHWNIDWGDGNVEPISGNPSSVTHYYADGPDNYTIVATADDEDGADWTTGGVAGALDYSYGTAGKVSTPFATGAGADYGRAMAVDGDGMIVVAGYNSVYDIQLAHYDTDGNLDTSFGDGGRVVSAFGGYDIVLAVAIQSDDKIVVAGYQINSSSADFALTRFNTDGTIDLSFGDGGRAITTFGGNDVCTSMVIQSDDKILVAGYTSGGSSYNFAIARYTADGRLDPSFDDDGKVTTDFNSGGDYARAIILQSDGKIVVVGEVYNGSNYDFALARYDTDGSLDTSFDGDGQVTTPIGNGNDMAYAVAVEGDRIVVAGRSSNGSNYDVAVACYDIDDGALDTTFDTDGKKTFAIGSGDDEAYAVAIQSTGEILLAGSTLNGSYDDFVVVRCNTSGALDTSFSDDGIQTIGFGSQNDQAYSMVLLEAEEQVLVSGYGYTSLNYDFAAARLNLDDGSLDEDFDSDGKVTTDYPGAAYAFAAVLQADQKIVSAGYAYVDGAWDFTLARYNTDGTLDTSFGDDGKQTTDFVSTNDYAYGMTMQPDQKIMVVGSAGGNFAVARYNTDGSPDTGFSGDGEIYQDIAGSTDCAHAVAVQSDNYIVVAGYAYVSGTYDFAVVRYDSYGSLDSSFSGDGKVTTPIGSESDYALAIALQNINDEEKILVAGKAYINGDFDFALVRYNADGTLDTSFDGDGKVTLDFAGGDDAIFDVAVLDDGKILAAGYAIDGSLYKFAMARFNANGSLDTSFGNDGIVLTPIASGYHSYGRSLEIQSDGKILLSGYISSGSFVDLALARYTAEGVLDETFDDDGKLTTDFGKSHDYGYAMVLQSDDRFVLAGMGHGDFQLARYLPGEVPMTVSVTGALPDYVAPGGVGYGEVSAAGIRYINGDVLIAADDLGAGFTRSYSSQVAADLGAGYGWQLTDEPYVTRTADQVVVVFNQQDAYWFGVFGDEYEAQFGASQTLIHVPDAEDPFFIFTDTDGTVYEFDDFSYTNARIGQFRKMTVPSGVTAEVVDWTEDGKIAEIQYALAGAAAAYQSLLFTYYDQYDPNAGRLHTIVLQRNSTNPESPINVRKVTYTYYVTDEYEPNGLTGDLKTAVCQSWLADTSEWTGDDTWYYRYYIDDAEGKGIAHGLKMAFAPQEYQNAYDDGYINSDDGTLKPYSSAYYEYDANGRATTATIGGSYTYQYAYTDSTLGDGYNNWERKTVETRPDGSTYTVYTNFLGEVILTDLADSSSNHWCTYCEYGESGYDDARLVLQAAPSAVSGYTEDVTLTVGLNASSGLLYQYVYYASTTATDSTPGGVAGYLQSESLLHGADDASPDLLGSYAYIAHTGTYNELSITIYPVATYTVYDEEDGAGAVTTEYDYDWYSGTLQPEQITTTLPAVSGDENGSGTSDETVQWYDEQGNLDRLIDQQCHITYYSYNPITGKRTGSIDPEEGGGTELGDVNYGVAAQDSATGVGYIMYSAEDVFQRFDPDPCANNSDHLVAVKYISGQWYYDDDTAYNAFTPVATDVLIAEVDFDANTITSLEGVDETENGIVKGFQAGDLSFKADWWNGGYDDGEFTIEGTCFVYHSYAGLVSLFDDAGRVTLTLGAVHSINLDETPTDVRTVNWTVYHDDDHETWYAQGYAEYDPITEEWDDFTLVGPVSIVKTDLDGLWTDEIQATWNDPVEDLLSAGPGDILQSTYVYWQTYQYSNTALVSARAYHAIPESGAGAEGTNYYQTSYGYENYGESGQMGRLNKIVTPDGTITRYVYDARGNLLETWIGTDDTGATDQDPTGGGYLGNDMTLFYEYIYDSGSDMGDGLLTESREYFDTGVDDYYATQYSYDWRGLMVEMTLPDPDGEGLLESPVYEYAYDNLGRLIQETDPLDNVTQYAYDSLGRLYRVTQPDPDGGGEQESPVTNYFYDEAGNLAMVVDALGGETTYDYDDFGRLTKVTLPDPDGEGPQGAPETEYVYDAAGNLTSMIDALDNVTTYEYDGVGRQVKIIQPDPDDAGPQEPPVIEYAYYDTGRLYSVTNPLGNVTTYEYDDLGRTVKATLPDPDGEGAGLSPWTVYTYDAMDRVLTVADRLGNTTTYEYDYLGQLVLETDAEGGETAYTYDLLGNMLTLTDPEENTTTWVYDPLGRMIEETNELSDTRYFEYNAVGLLTEKTDRNERITLYEYDNLYRLTEEINSSETFSYTYDALGNLLTASDSYNSYSYEYDALGRLIEETQNLLRLDPEIVLTYQYNANGQRTQVATTIDGVADAVADYDYDNLGRATMIEQYGVQGGNAVAEKRVDVAYDAASQYATIARYADLAGTDLVATATYTFDDAYHLIGLNYVKGETTLSEYTYTYDAAGNMTSMTTVDGAVDYTNDDTGQLTGADYDYQDDESYAYDSNGNRTSGGCVTGANNQLLFDGTYTYEYDAEGNRTWRYVDEDQSGTLSDGDTEVTYYIWDHRDRLSGVFHYPAWGSGCDWWVDYEYDAFNRLVYRFSSHDCPELSEAYVYDGDQIALQFHYEEIGAVPAEAMTHRYLWDPQAVDQLLADEQLYYDNQQEEFITDELLWALTDHLNSVRDLATYDSGQDETTVALHRVFDAFGNETSSTGTAECLFGYTGKLFDEDTQLQNNWHRWYDPAVGRWLSEDTIGFNAGDLNLYRYVGNSTLTRTDPTGNKWYDWTIVGPILQIPYYWVVQVSEWNKSTKLEDQLRELNLRKAGGDPEKLLEMGLMKPSRGNVQNAIQGSTFVARAGVEFTAMVAGGAFIAPGAYVEAHGFKFSEYYWNRLWTTGRPAPGLVAREVLAGAAGKGVAVAGKPGFFRYVYGGWEMIYNPVTREVWHLQPIP